MRHAVNKSCAAAKSGCERLSLTIIVAMSVTSWGTTRHIPDVFGFLKLWACPDNADYPVETMRLSVLLSPPVIGLLALATSLVALGKYYASAANYGH